jgi:hypothetical protein
MIFNRSMDILNHLDGFKVDFSMIFNRLLQNVLNNVNNYKYVFFFPTDFFELDMNIESVTIIFNYDML